MGDLTNQQSSNLSYSSGMLNLHAYTTQEIDCVMIWIKLINGFQKTIHKQAILNGRDLIMRRINIGLKLKSEL